MAAVNLRATSSTRRTWFGSRSNQGAPSFEQLAQLATTNLCGSIGYFGEATRPTPTAWVGFGVRLRSPVDVRSRRRRDGSGHGDIPRVPTVARPAVEARGPTGLGSGDTEVRALSHVDFTVEPGAFVAIMGPSGSGKSTLLHILGALDRRPAGTVAVGGVRYTGLYDKDLTRFAASSSVSSFSSSTSCLADGGRERATPGADRRRPPAEIEERVARAACARRARTRARSICPPRSRRRAAAGVDRASAPAAAAGAARRRADRQPRTRAGGRSCCGLLRRVRRDGQTVVMVTHDAAAATLADRVMFVRDGQIAARWPATPTASRRPCAPSIGSATPTG